MSLPAVLGLTGALLSLLLLETVLAFTGAPRALLPGVGLAMTAIVATGFMRLTSAGTLACIFAAAGLFWLCVMLGLGSMDPATRTDIPVERGIVLPANR